MKKRIQLLTLLLLTALNAFSQIPEFDWATLLTGIFGGEPARISLDSSGNVYTCGNFSSGNNNVDFDPGPGVYDLSVSEDGFYLTKLDSEGSLIYARVFESTSCRVQGMITDSLGHVYMSGEFAGTLDADPGSGTFLLNTVPEYDWRPFIVKLTVEGNLDWAFVFGSPDQSSMSPRSLAIDRSGNLVVSGKVQGTHDFDPGPGSFVLTGNFPPRFFIAKYNAEGGFIWAGVLGNSSDPGVLAYPVAIDKTDHIYQGGNFGGYLGQSSDFDPGPGITLVEGSTVDEIVISKLDGAGNFQWVKAIYGDTSVIASNLQIISMSLDGEDNILVTGRFNGLVDFDPGPGEAWLYVEILPPFTTTNNTLIFVLKLDSEGNFIWARQLGAGAEIGSREIGLGVAADAYNNVYVSGVKYDMGDYDPGPDTFYLEDVGGIGNTFIAKLDRDGRFVWAGQMAPYQQNFFTSDRGIKLDRYGDIYTYGRLRGENDADPGSGVFNLSPEPLPFTPGAGHYTLKLRQCLYMPELGSPSGCPGDLSARLVDTLPVPEYVPAQYLWSTGDTTADIRVTPLVPTTYGVTITAGNGCTYVREAEVSPHDRPEAEIYGVEEACLDEEVLLEGVGGSSYLWSHGDTAAVTTVHIGGDTSYVLTVTNASGCTDTDTLHIAVFDAFDVEVSEDTLVCSGRPLTLFASGGSSYQWSIGETTAAIDIAPLATTVYDLTITDANGCTVSMAIKVAVSDDLKCPDCAVLPNAFTPDGDGINDVFQVLSPEGIEVLDFRIYNRWGSLVHNSVQPLPNGQMGWDGRWNGEPQPVGVYLYHVRVNASCGMKVLTGEVTLIR